MEIKEPITFEEQVKKIEERGCVIGDPNFAKIALMHINYYRLTAYFLPFKKSDGTYKDGTTFNCVYRIYEFDRKLRKLILSTVEEIEIMLRTQISYYHGHKYGSLGYEDENNFNSWHNHDLFTQKYTQAIDENSNQPFVKHHIDNYDGHFPIWVIVEILTIGSISKFYSDMILSDKKAIARDLFGSTYKNVSVWLHCLTVLRNYCAHYSRLYYTLFAAIPPTPKNFSYTLGKRIFDYILVLKFLYPDPVRWNTSFVIELENLLEEYSDAISFKHIGFPENWKGILLEPNPKVK